MAVHRRRSASEECAQHDYSRSPGIQFSVEASGLARTVVHGTLAAATCAALLEARQAAGLLDHPLIIDARDATVELSLAEVRTLAARVRTMRQRMAVGPTAFVACGDLSYGLARMYASFDEVEGLHGFGVFRTIEEAEHWIWDVT